MATRTLPLPRNPHLNLLVYDNGGNLLATFLIPENPTARYLTSGMLYRYCAWIFIFPLNSIWEIYHLDQDGITPGPKLHRDEHTKVSPGNYVVLNPNRGDVLVTLTDHRAPRRVVTVTKSTETGRDTLVKSSQINKPDDKQRKFRNAVRERDQGCTFTGVKVRTGSEKPYRHLQPVHIFPTKSEWERGNHQRFIQDTSPASEIGAIKTFSPQNGLLLRADIHGDFDAFSIGVDPDDDFKIICFEIDEYGLGGRRLATSAKYPSNPAQHASRDLLRWHLMQCVYKNMKANAEPQEVWEDDLGSNEMGEILEQPDAGERMEVELFTRLGGLVA